MIACQLKDTGSQASGGEASEVELSIIMPCLNEAETRVRLSKGGRLGDDITTR